MKVHTCGSRFHRQGENMTEKGGDRYRCPRCRVDITVRDGKIVGEGAYREVPDLVGRSGGRPEIKDWRHG